ncbi:WD40 domain-containing protein [Encephalitozoon intestinalis ATCC 50506]|uniref:WD40 domain-containing protein n=1 Tax=Encephalitozoon intestinalis (strain ATCC 50506) TaxID=876142 RepID=E0S7C4_ENCIT|nr:WD40 domain-containing protein [Encephalitozoon intestinalis ATCC 50506]ADM11552.1 WD40 domain-containing protein [Encephalitozoon intestinalis ATCC 50506]UTX45266.1 WD40 domain-containing protein [Encephalitozoon intestinalis]
MEVHRDSSGSEEEATEFSSNDYEVYEPQADDENLEVSEEAYNVMEYISLDWPAQSIDILRGFTVVLGTNPSEGGTPGMVSIDLFPTNGMKAPEKMRISKRKVKESYNKVRVNGEMVYCLSDDKLVVHNSKFDEVYRRDIGQGLGYGLCFGNSGCVFGTKEGEISINDWKFNEVGTMKIHEGSIESLCYHGGMVFSGSCDHSVKITDIRSGSNIFQKKFEVDINAVDFNGDYLLAFGDDSGMIRLMDIRNHMIEEVQRHKTPISCLKWRDSDILVSGSDEQVCIWDVSLDASEEGGYLLFVHQGQRFYKDITFCRGDNNYVVTTSIDGLCVFYPISFDT